MRTILYTALLLSVLFSTNLFAATYNSAINAYERRDYKTAEREFKQLSHANDPYSQYMLGKMYSEGQGIRKDYVKAYRWLQAAENNNIHQAGRLKNTIAKRMSKRDLKKAHKLIDEQQDDYGFTNFNDIKTSPTLIRQIQQKLHRNGYLHNKIDGIMGSKTRDAIKKYQRDNRMFTDGRVTDNLLSHMGISTHNQVNYSDTSILKQKLKKIIKKAKRKNSADPWVIKQLEMLTKNEQLNPWPSVIMSDNFSSASTPEYFNWQIASGAFQMKQNYGLIGFPNNSWSYSSNNSDQVRTILLNSIFKHATGNQSQKRIAKIQKDVNFSNAFSLKLETAHLQQTEGLVLSCSVDKNNLSGYRLVFRPGQWDKVKLLRIGKNKTFEIKNLTSQIAMERNGPHTITWDRTEEGVMRISFDGEQLFTATDNVMTTPFQQISIAHIGEQFALKSVELSGNKSNRYTI